MLIRMVALVTSSALFPAIQLAFNMSHFRFNRVDGQRLYLTGLPGRASMVFSKAFRCAFRVLSVSDQLALFCSGLFIAFILALFWIAQIFGLLRYWQTVELD